MTGPEDLRETLDDLAGTARPVDLYERSLRRSRRIGRNRAMVVAGAAVAVLGLAGYGLVSVPPPVVPPPPQMAVSSPSPSEPPAPPPATRIPGRIFYSSSDGLVRLDPDGGVTELGVTGLIAVSPDGERVASVRDGRLRVDGEVALDVMVDDNRPPAWSPDGKRLAVSTPRPGILDVATRRVIELPLAGRGFRWSGDGTRFVYGTADCRLMMAGVDDRTGVTVPVIGDPSNGINPEQVAACAATSVDRTGDRVTVALTGVGSADGYGQESTGLVDTRTGEVLPPPVPGRAESMLFDPAGNLLVRVRAGDGFRLVVVAPDGWTIATADEPAEVRGMTPVAYTRWSD